MKNQLNNMNKRLKGYHSILFYKVWKLTGIEKLGYKKIKIIGNGGKMLSKEDVLKQQHFLNWNFQKVKLKNLGWI